MPSTALSPTALPGGLVALPGVYQPQADTRLLATALAHEDLDPRTEVLEVGTGTGALALQAATRGAQVTTVDVSWPAVVTARLNAWIHHVPLRVLHGDFEARTSGRRFDVVVSNPPYVPAPDSRLPSRGPERAWDAGVDKRAIIDRICGAAPTLLRPGGVLLMVHSGMCGTEETLDRLAGAGLTAQVRTTAPVPWGPILRSRRSWLEQRGLATEAEEWEELVVIRAQRP